MKFYRRDAEVIHPPVDVNRFRIRKKKEDFFLIVTSFAPYKKVDLAIKAFGQIEYPLKVIGVGPEGKKLKSMAKSNYSRQKKAELMKLLSSIIKKKPPSKKKLSNYKIPSRKNKKN